METSRTRILRRGQRRAAAAVCLAAAVVGSLGIASASSASPVTSSPAATSQPEQRRPPVAGCPYLYLCLYEGFQATGTIHLYYYCRVHPIGFDFNSVVNNQTEGTRASFRGLDGNEIFRSPGALWSSGNTDTIAGNLGRRTYYLKPC